MKTLFDYGRFCLFGIFFYTWTAICTTVGFPLLLFSRRFAVWVAKGWSFGILKGAKFIIGLTYEVRGQAYLGEHENFIIACKHQSTWETIALTFLLPDPIFVLKASLMRVPFFGFFLRRMGMIPVGKKKRSLFSSELASRVPLQKGQCIIIFPEGTRVPVGQAPSYRKGVYYIARELNLKIIPAALNAGIFWPRRTLRKLPGKVVLEFLPPMEVPTERDTFMRDLQETIESRSHALIQEAKGMVERGNSMESVKEMKQ